ncbi:hypothetical protein [Mesorhizobium sp.]|uniref:hypothetical protein n=1 Tax=Mesorhizobium sp. TaxID=1871066 RepID=UPI0011F502A9|nr:hypothetical protein [Mesorhizobium sp.]TIL43657.1 MAG: hypothetical protein E5Y86_20835 [Mesorhizobium sp.]
MHINANKASSFIAVAHYGDNCVKTASFTADATIKEVFEAFWPEEGNLGASVGRFDLPTRLELTPDERVVPPDERFKGMFDRLVDEKGNVVSEAGEEA